MRDKAYRRHTHQVHDKRWRRIIADGGYNPYRGYIKYDLKKNELGIWEYEYEPYIRECSNGRAKRYYKKYSNRQVRRSKEILQNNNYRKVFELWYTLF